MVASPVLSALPKRQETLSRCLEDAINRLSAEQIYTHPEHNFKHSSDRVRGGCPHHQSKSGSSFVVSTSSKLFWCAGCQFGGSPADYRASLRAGRWVKARGRDFVEAVRELAADANVPFPEREPSPEEIARAAKWERRRAVLAATQEYCQEVLWSDRVEALEARHYLVSERGLTEEEIKLLPIGYYPNAGELKRHLISKGFSDEDWKGTGCVWKDMERYITFLWSDASGRPLTIYGRYFTQYPPEGKPKTIATPGEKTKQSPLYFDRALKAGHKEITLVEGVLDAVLLQAKGDTRVCAYVAASCSGDQIETIKRRGITKVTLCGDPDHGGERGTNSNLLRLTEAGISVYITPKLPDGLDPDEFLLAYEMEGWKAHIDAAEHGFRWKARRLTESGDTSTDKGKAEVLRNAIAFCKAVKNHPELDMFFWPVIRNSLGMEPEEFRAQLERLWESSPTEVASFGGSGSGGGDDGGDGGNGKVIKFPGFEPLTIGQVTEKIDELIATGVTGSYLTGQLNRLAAASQYYIGELRKLYHERLGEADLEVERDHNRGEVENLLFLTDQSLDLHDYIPEELATPLTAWCECLSIRPAVALTALLAGVSSLHKVGTEMILHRNQNFRVPPTLYGALVSPSGQRKSPVFTNIIRQPLSQLRQEKIDAYNAAMADYEAAMEAWDQSENKGQKPDKPKEPTLYYFTNATGEAIPVQASKAPDKALLALIDELSGLLKSENSYRNGRGSDKQDLLSYFDGSGQTILRSGGIRVDLDKIYLSMFGTIQPEVLKSHMAGCDDPDGQWARFLFVKQPLVAATLSDDDGQAVQIRDRIADFYRQTERIPEMEYRLSRAAFKRYQPVYNQLERLRVTQPKSGMAAVYSKAQGYIGRLAVNLHVLWELASGKACPDEEIPLFIMEMAIALTKFYIGQVKLIHADADEENLPRHITRMMELSKRLEVNGFDGWVKAKQVQDLFPKKKRPSALAARDWMNEAVALGYGRTRGKGNRLEYHWLRDNDTPSNDSPTPDCLGNLGNSLGNLGNDVPQGERLINQDIQTNLGNLGKGIPKFDEEEKIPIPLPDNPPEDVGGIEAETHEEGGEIPQASPTLPQEPQTLEESSDSDLGNNLGNPSPTLPQVCDSSAGAVTVEVAQPHSKCCGMVGTVKEEETVAPMPLEQTTSTSADESEEAIAPATVASSPAVDAPTAPAATEPTQQPLRPNQRVRIHCKGSKRDHKVGTVRKVDGEDVVVWLDDSSLPYDLRRWECHISWLELLD